MVIFFRNFCKKFGTQQVQLASIMVQIAMKLKKKIKKRPKPTFNGRYPSHTDPDQTRCFRSVGLIRINTNLDLKVDNILGMGRFEPDPVQALI